MTDYLQLARERAAGAPPSDAANPYMGIAQENRRRQETQLRGIVERALKDDPELAAERQRLSQTSGLPLSVVERNLDEIRRKEAARALDIARMMRDSPVLSRQLLDPTFTTVAQDDLGVLGQIERFARDLGGAAKAGVFRASRGAAGTFQAGLELVAPVLDPLESVTAIGGNPLRRLAEGFALQGAAAGRTAEAARPRTDGVLGAGFFGGIESLTQNLLALPMAFLPGGQGAALTMMTAGTGGGAYQDAREKGLPMSQALPFAASQAAIEYATEKLPLGALLKDVRAGAGFLQILGRQIALEVPGEQIATVLQDLNEWAILNPDKPFSAYLEERPSAAAQTLIATVVGTGGNVAVVKGLESVMSRLAADGANMQRAGLAGQALQRAFELAGQSALRERSPEQFRALMGQMSGDAKLYVDGEVLNQLPPEALAQLPAAVRDRIPLAAATGDMVEIAVADALTVAPGTPLAETLTQNARTSPEAPSLREAEEAGQQAQVYLQQEAERVIQQAADQAAARASQEAVKQNIKQQLAATGRFRDAVNEGYATWAAAFYTAYGSRLGMTPEQFYQRYPLRVLGAAPGQQTGVLNAPGGATLVDPGSLNFREGDQNRLDSVREMFPQGEGYPPIVAINDAGQRTILDGHNRAAVAMERGEQIPVVDISQAQYDALKAAGFDDIEIAYAALEQAGEQDAADAINAQFPGAGVRRRGREAQDAEGVFEQSVTTMVPTTKDAAVDPADVKVPSLEAADQPDEKSQKALAANVGTFEVKEQVIAGKPKRGYDSIKVEGNTPREKAESIIRQMVRNLRTIFAAIPESIRQRSKLWYDGANRVSLAFADRYGLTPMQTAGQLAVTSPQADWYMNVSYVERINDILTYRQDHAWDAEMEAWAEAWINSKTQVEGRAKEAERKAQAVKDAVKAEKAAQRALDKARADLEKNTPKLTEKIDAAEAALKEAEQAVKDAKKTGTPAELKRAEVQAGKRNDEAKAARKALRQAKGTIGKAETVLRQARADIEEKRASAAEPDENLAVQPLVRGKKLSELTTDFERAWWVRAYDEAHNPRSYRVVTPEGAFLDFAKLDDGTTNDSIGWKSFSAIAKAISIYRDGSLENVHAQLGGEHKVRNFYNNIFAPNSDTPFVTSDTHQVAANLFLPLGADALEVGQNFGGTGSKSVGATGLNGTYWLYHEAVVQAAKAEGIRPREMQSISWEAIRNLFSPSFKANPDSVAAVRDLWVKYQRGEATYEDTIRAVVDLAGGEFRPPTWVGTRPDSAAAPENGATSYESGLAHAGPGQQRRDQPGPGDQGVPGPGVLTQGGLTDGRPQPAGDGAGRYSSGSLAPLEGAPNVAGASGPDPRLVAVAERYARDNGIPLRRQGEYAKVDPERAARIAAAYDAMVHAPQDPAVREAYENLIQQTLAQYRALEAAGYRFYLVDESNDPYGGNPWNAMRDLRANQVMGVFATEAGFGSGATELNVEDNPLLADTGLRWPYGSPDGEPKRVLANDLFRAVHDAFGHGLEGAGFRAQGEENAWQAHIRLFTGSAKGAITSETRGQNSWLNFGPYGESNRNAKVEDTVFADQKTGLMPEWTWSEGIVEDMPDQPLAQGPRGTFNPATLELVLNPNADLSTWFHETGHFFLEVLADVASQPGAPAQIAEDYAKVLAWFGVTPEQWASFTLDQKRPYHERWAESIEQYVMEGKAPSVELQPVMRRFSAWLKSVYQSIKQFLAQRGVPVAGGETLGQGARRFSSLRGMRPTASYVDATPRQQATLDAIDAGPDSTDFDLLPAKEDINVSADSHFTEWEREPSVKFVALDLLGPFTGYDNAKDTARIRRLADSIKESNAIEPIFVGIDPNGEAYVMEGQHRVRALQLLGETHVPAQVIVSMEGTEDDYAALPEQPQPGPTDYKAVAGQGTLFQGNQPQPLNIQLNDDIRRVMNRMLATDEQIAQANEVAGLMPDEQADGEAAERLQKRSIADLKWAVKARDKVIAKLKREAREIEKATRAQVTTEVDQRPEVLAKAAIEKAEKEFEADPVSADMNIAAIADAFGYPSVEVMYRAIELFGDKREAIDGLVEQRMLEEHGDLIDERAIQQAANEAVHNEARARSLATELRTQQEMLSERADTGQVNARGARMTVNVLVEAAKQFGANVIARTPLKDLRATAWKHTAAERRAGKRWTEATMAGDTQAAVQAKQDQMLNNAAAKAALEATAESKKILEFFARVTKGNDEKTVEKGRDPDIVNAARAVLAAYGIETPASKGAAAYLEVLQKNDPDTFNAVAPMMAAATQNAQPLEALTFEELQGLAEQIRAMWFLAKRSRQMEVDGNLLDIDDVAQELFARMEEIGIPDRVPGEGMAVTKEEERGLFLKQGIAFLRRVEQWAEGMDGKYGGPFLRFIFQPIKDAADRYRKDRIEYRKRFQALVDNLAPIVGDSVIEAPELGYTFGTPGSTAGTAMNEILHAIAHTGNESNKRKLLLGRGWATENPDGTLDTTAWDTFLRRLVNEGKLERAHFDFVQGVWDLLEDTKPLAQKAHRDAFGRFFSEVTADAFVDPFGVTRRGGYIPAQVDTRLVKDNVSKRLAEEENNSMAYAFPQPAKGFTMARVDYNRELLLDLRALSQHIDKVLLFSHMTNPARDVRKLLTRKTVSQPLDRIQPAAIESMLQPWLQRSAQQIVETPIVGTGKWARLPGLIRARAGMALMFANVSNAIQQITGLSTAAVRVKPSFLMRSVAQYVANPVKFSRAVWGASPYMDDRAKNEVAVLNEQMQAILLKPSTFERAQDFSMRHAYFLQTALDNVLSPIVWTGAFNQALADGMSDADAVRFADSTVRQTQGSTLPEDVSRLETGPAYARVFTQFVGYFNMMANTNGTALKQLAGEVGLKKGAGRALYIVMMGFMVPIWVAEAIALAFRGGPEDEDDDGYLDDWLAEVFGMGTAKGLLAQIPIVGQFAVAGMQRFNDNPLDDRVSLSPAVSLLESSVGAPQSVYKAIVEDGSAQKAIRDVATLVSVATGVPVYSLARPIGYAAGVAQDRIEPEGLADLARGLITGTASPESRAP